MVEEPDPPEGGQLDDLVTSPRAPLPDHFGLVEADHRLGQGVILGVPLASRRGLDARGSEPLGVANGEVLDASVAVMDQPFADPVPALPERLLQGLKRRVAPQRRGVPRLLVCDPILSNAGVSGNPGAIHSAHSCYRPLSTRWLEQVYRCIVEKTQRPWSMPHVHGTD